MKEITLLQNILEAGLEFESDVLQDIKPLRVQRKEELEPLNKESLIIHVPEVFRNQELGIQGISDLMSRFRRSVASNKL